MCYFLKKASDAYGWFSVFDRYFHGFEILKKIIIVELTWCYMGSMKFGCYYLQYVPASKLFDYAWFEVLKTISLYCTWFDNP